MVHTVAGYVRLVLLPILISLFFILSVAEPLQAQQAAVQDIFVDYERTMHVHGALPSRSVAGQPVLYSRLSTLDTLQNHPWATVPWPDDQIWNRGEFITGVYDPEIRSSWRSLRPGGINNGAVWEGRGLTTSLTVGLYVRYHMFSMAFRPLLIYHQNRDFSLSRYEPLGGSSEFSYPYLDNIDLPQRFGTGSFQTFDPGPSYVRADFRGFEAGLSNKNRWWGPARYYPVIMSNNTPGFQHFFAGTERPHDIYIGALEATVIWGRLLESNFFDDQSWNDERYITGLTLSFSPAPVPDLTLGFNRVYFRLLPPEGIPVRELFKVFETFTKSARISNRYPTGADDYSQMLSFFGRWVFPESGFEVYGEWSRNDHAWNLRDALGEPEHSRGYMAGLQKTFRMTGGDVLAVNAEIVNIEITNTERLRSQGSYYRHRVVSQGYTQKGQLLGLGTGPGSSSQILNGRYYFADGRFSSWIRRTVYNNDFLYRSEEIMDEPENVEIARYWLHNFELGAGASMVAFYEAWEAELGLELVREFNQDYLYKNDRTHVALQVRVRYRLSSLR